MRIQGLTAITHVERSLNVQSESLRGRYLEFIISIDQSIVKFDVITFFLICHDFCVKSIRNYFDSPSNFTIQSFLVICIIKLPVIFKVDFLSFFL